MLDTAINYRYMKAERSIGEAIRHLVAEHDFSRDELFTEVGWLQVLIGQGVQPLGHHALADAIPPADLADFLALARTHAAAVAARMPAHDAFIAAHCAAPVSKAA